MYRALCLARRCGWPKGSRNRKSGLRMLLAAKNTQTQGLTQLLTTLAGSHTFNPVATPIPAETNSIPKAASAPATATTVPLDVSAAEAAAVEEAARPRKYTHTTMYLPLARPAGRSPSAAISRPSIATGGDYMLPHPIWSGEHLKNIEGGNGQTHQPPSDIVDRIALAMIRTMRFNFDTLSGYNWPGRRKTEKLWLNRILFLESVAAVPGSIGATIRHLASLRRLRRDHGWIHTLLEEGENERMHLLTAMELRAPGLLFRMTLTLTQGIFFNVYWMAYFVSPRFCHRMVGYLEEEAVKTYTTLLECIDKGEIWRNAPAPVIARGYWRLPETATMRDVIANIRADETHHRDVNHTFANIGQTATNPYPSGH